MRTIDELYTGFFNRIKNLKIKYTRTTIKPIDWNDRMLCIRGARGCGKTTFLLNHIKSNFSINETILYVSLDDIYFSSNSLLSFAEEFVKHGGKYLFLDEIHKYPNWSRELKNIYDSLPELKVVITGSSILEIHKGEADLSRRVVNYDMAGLSFREFILFETGTRLDPISLNELLKNHLELSMKIAETCKPLALFNEYLKIGYYPYYLESKLSYHEKLAATVNLTLETDLPAVHPIEFSNIIKLKRLLNFLSNSGPYKPDIVKLSGQIEVSRNTLLHFINYLREASLLNFVRDTNRGEGVFTKPDKIYLHNTNLAYAFGANTTDVGMLREVFFLNQVSAKYRVNHTKAGDFKVEEKYIFEVGGKSKSFDQIKDLPDSYLAVDSIEYGTRNRIPLYLFGMMY